MPANLTALVHFSASAATKALEFGGAKNHRNGADIGEPRPDVRRSQSGIDLAVEPLMISGDVPTGAQTPIQVLASYPGSVSAMDRHVRQHVESLAACHRERAQAA